jgi:protein YIPF6
MLNEELSFHETYSHSGMSLEGEISGGDIHKTNQRLSTLDEPIRQTMLRDIRAVAKKFLYVLYPRTSSSLLKEWDLWGPLILCTIMAVILHSGHDVKGGGPEFAEMFILFWLGAIIVTLNTKLLGGDISIFQSVCVLGYCALPLVVALIVCTFIFFIPPSLITFLVRLILVTAAMVWSIFASTAFLTGSKLANRKALAIYPIGLFYFVLGWLILSHNSVAAVTNL